MIEYKILNLTFDEVLEILDSKSGSIGKKDVEEIVDDKLTNYPTKSTVEETYVKKSDLDDSYAKKEDIEEIEEELTTYAKKLDVKEIEEELTTYAKKEDIEDFVKKEDIEEYAKKEDIETALTDYAKKEDIETELSEYIKKDDIETELSNYVKKEDINDEVPTKKTGTFITTTLVTWIVSTYYNPNYIFDLKAGNVLKATVDEGNLIICYNLTEKSAASTYGSSLDLTIATDGQYYIAANGNGIIITYEYDDTTTIPKWENKGFITESTLNTELAKKLDLLTIDSEILEDSANPVENKGIYNYLNTTTENIISEGTSIITSSSSIVPGYTAFYYNDDTKFVSLPSGSIITANSAVSNVGIVKISNDETSSSMVVSPTRSSVTYTIEDSEDYTYYIGTTSNTTGPLIYKVVNGTKSVLKWEPEIIEIKQKINEIITATGISVDPFII